MNGKRPGGWVALAWRYFRDPRFDEVSADAELLWCHALAYCGEQETNGDVGVGQLVGLSQRLRGSPRRAAGELVRAGLWVTTERGYRFPRWADWQETAEQKEAARARAAEMKRRQRESRRASAKDNGEDNGEDNARTARGSPPTSGSGSGAGAGAGHSPLTPAPDAATLRSASGSEPEDDGEPSPDWVEFTDLAGNLFVRPAP